MQDQEQLLDAVNVMWNHWKSIVKWALITMAVSIPLTLIMKNYYKATTVFYPASQDFAKPDQLFGNTTKELEFYGSGQDLDRLLTIGTSNEVKDKLISEFHLYQHYNIDSSKTLAKHKIRKKLNKLMSVLKTKYDAVELSIEDQDKGLATDMTNRAREIVNASAYSLLKNRLHEVGNLYKKGIDEKSVLLNVLSDSLTSLRKIYPIYNIDAQTETLANLVTELSNQLVGEKVRYESLKANQAPKDTLMYISARIKALESQVKSLNTGEGSSFNLKIFNEGVNKINSLESSIERLQGQINEDKIKYQNTLNTIDSDADAIITVSEAETPDYKSRPTRSLLILGAGIAAGVAMALYHLLKHYTFSKIA